MSGVLISLLALKKLVIHSGAGGAQCLHSITHIYIR